MNYKQKYEEALERAKTLHKLACETQYDNTRLAVEELFPELKESENDRIKKNLREFLLDAPSQDIVSHHLDLEETLNWLEKQSEQKLEQEEDAELTDFESALFSAFSDAWQEYLSGKEVNVAKWAREHSAELLEVARGQISAWSEDDEDNYVTALWHIKRSSGREGSVYNWLKSIKDRMKGGESDGD